ncbi:MAG: alpha-ketoglutarate-dependent dioxygenase AlkB [Pseudomonadota bacterium]
MNEAAKTDLFGQTIEKRQGVSQNTPSDRTPLPELPKGAFVWPQMLHVEAQNALLSHLREAVAVAPLFTPAMPRTGKPLSVQMTNLGDLGWLTDKESGYRYQSTHPTTGRPWPPIPPMLLDLWKRCAPDAPKPQACLVNYYRDTAKMGLHQDKDEQNLEAPVVSISLGDTCLFRLGGTTRGGKTQSFKLHSGDVMMLSGPARLAFHGVDRVYPGTSDLLKGGGRINLTLRVVG